MKKLLFIASALILNTAIMKAQITLEHVFDSTWFGGDRFYCTDIGNNDFKYVFLDGKTNSFSLYNLDMSPFLMNISIPVSDSIKQGFRVIYITKTLFDCDSNNIEYVYENPYNINNKFWIFRIDGTILLEVDSANGPYGFGASLGGSITQRPILNTSAGAKLFVQKYDNNNIPRILVYSLCGEAPITIADFSETTPYLKVFPNPTDKSINFEISPINNYEELQILIFDAASREHCRKDILMYDGKFSIDVREYNSGTYFYSLIGKNKVYLTGKFILTK